jgi:hypothetical protein
MWRLLVLVVVATSFASGAAAAPLAPSKPSQLADLTTDYSASCPSNAKAYVVNRISKSDGTQAAFTIPEKQVFVVTGFEISTQLLTSGHRYETGLFRQDPASPNVLSSISFVDDVSNGNGRLVLTLPSGAVVKSGILLCAIVIDFDGGGAISFPSVLVHGFFTKDK